MNNKHYQVEISITNRLQEYGELKIDNFELFLDNSKYLFNERWKRPFDHKETLADFQLLLQLGNGAFGDVLLIKGSGWNEFYAMKCLLKKKIMKQKQLVNTKNEKRVMQSLDFPMTVYLKYFFKDNSYIYFVMPFITGGELFGYHRKCGKFDEDKSRFYVSQVVLALEYLHFLDLVYRDVKPENIMIDHTGYLKLIDFGFCKPMTKKRTYTFCGTPDYLAPEIILSKGYGKAVDWWAVGIFMYEMVAGTTPFSTNDSMKTFEKIVANRYTMPKYFSSDLQDLVNNLLKVDLSERFGNLKNGVNDIKEHKWFRPISWLAILNKKVKPPYIPPPVEPGDISSMEMNKLKPMKNSQEDKYSQEFANF